MQAYRVAHWSSRGEHPGEQLCRLLRRHFVVSRHLCCFHAKQSCCPSSYSPASGPCGIWMALCLLFFFYLKMLTCVMSRCREASNNNLARCLEKTSDSRPCNIHSFIHARPRLGPHYCRYCIQCGSGEQLGEPSAFGNIWRVWSRLLREGFLRCIWLDFAPRVVRVVQQVFATPTELFQEEVEGFQQCIWSDLYNCNPELLGEIPLAFEAVYNGGLRQVRPPMTVESLLTVQQVFFRS